MPSQTIDEVFQTALAHQRAGQLRDAEMLYRKILIASPVHVGSLHNFGIILRATQRAEQATDCFTRATELQPGDAGIWNELGITHAINNNFSRAIECFEQAVKLAPERLDARNNLANALKDSGAIGEAIQSYQQLLQLKPDLTIALHNLGNAQKSIGRYDEAVRCYTRAIELQPDFVEALDNLADTWKQLGDLEKAAACFRRVLQLHPQSAKGHLNLGVVLADSNRSKDAIACYRKALAIEPGNATAHYFLGMELLLVGQFIEGWRECEFRWDKPDLIHLKPTYFQPMWDGKPLADHTILVHSEQGFGDVLQFVRYLPMIERLGGKIILECHPRLARLLTSVVDNCQVVHRDQPRLPFDCHCPIMSLPYIFGTTLDTVPADVPYLQPTIEESARWRDRLATLGSSMKVGLCWSGASTIRNRSITLAALAPLQKLTGIHFISLQKVDGSTETRADDQGLQLLDWGEDPVDFADSAALVANLDLIITVDTATAHLAGGLGRPVWVLLPFAAEWRWLLDRTDSPWYPTMRLFRQQLPGDWTPVISDVANELANLQR